MVRHLYLDLPTQNKAMKILCLIGLFVAASAYGCLNESGSVVDWWVILKMPTISSVFPEGSNYYYCDALNSCTSLKRGATTITSASSPLLRTVAQFNQQPVQLMWNDQLYDGRTMSNHAHSKGLASSDGSRAILINHSVPKFPILDSAGKIVVEYPSNGLMYGQHMFCMTTTLNDLESVANAYLQAEVNVFASTFPVAMQSLYPRLYQLSKQKLMRSNTRMLFESSTLSTLGGLAIQIFSSSPAQQDEFYSGFIGARLGVGFVAETWGSGPGGLEDPICSSGHESISNLEVYIDGTLYKYTKDHSKYAISLNANKPYVCFSDINRQVSQHKRGGSAICFNHAPLWNTLNNIMSSRQSC